MERIQTKYLKSLEEIFKQGNENKFTGILQKIRKYYKMLVEQDPELAEKDISISPKQDSDQSKKIEKIKMDLVPQIETEKLKKQNYESDKKELEEEKEKTESPKIEISDPVIIEEKEDLRNSDEIEELIPNNIDCENQIEEKKIFVKEIKNEEHEEIEEELAVQESHLGLTVEPEEEKLEDEIDDLMALGVIGEENLKNHEKEEMEKKLHPKHLRFEEIGMEDLQIGEEIELSQNKDDKLESSDSQGLEKNEPLSNSKDGSSETLNQEILKEDKDSSQDQNPETQNTEENKSENDYEPKNQESFDKIQSEENQDKQQIENQIEESSIIDQEEKKSENILEDPSKVKIESKILESQEVIEVSDENSNQNTPLKPKRKESRKKKRDFSDEEYILEKDEDAPEIAEQDQIDEQIQLGKRSLPHSKSPEKIKKLKEE